MRRNNNAFFYISTLLGLLIVLYFVLHEGRKLESINQKPVAEATTSLWNNTFQLIRQPLSIFMLQMIVIILSARACSYLFRKMNQPAVMGEIVAGILLGPSLLGIAAPEISAFLFPQSSIGNIKMLSQIGLTLFMFVIGMELDWNLLKKKAGTAIVISHASIVFPFGAGLVLSYFLYKPFALPQIPFYAFALFMGIAMSITAFPVLARILKERKLTDTRMGVLALTSAAADDVTAWCLLAVIIAVAKAGSVSSSLYTLLFAVSYVCLMLFLVKPLLKRIPIKQKDSGTVPHATLALLFIVLLTSAWICEIIGIHALFGAFMAGVVMPSQPGFRKIVMDKVEDVALVLLLPLFFVATGLQTQIGLLNSGTLWLICAGIITIAVLGKFGGSSLAAYISGESLKDSLSIGALMNTRGLMELVVLNIGYELHILSAKMFAMMVIMAIITTLMTTPALSLINRIKDKKRNE